MSKGTVVVTGCSSGIGLASAKEFALRGYSVIAGARRLGPMEELKQYGVKVISLDITSKELVQLLVKLIELEYNGELKYLFNNAGQPCSIPALDVTDEQIEQCFQVNVFGQARLVRELSPFLIKAKGTIGFTGSVSGLLPFPFSSIYGSTKAAIHQYASILAFELEPFGVKVINVITGAVDTNIADTRPVPDTSIYQTKGLEEIVSRRREMAKRNNPWSAEKYAYYVVNDFENSKVGVLNYYRGGKAILLGWFWYAPRFVIIRFFKRFFGLFSLWAELKRRYQ